MVRFPDISSRAWEHPADRAALQALRKVPGFDLVIRKVFGLVSERPLRVITLGSAVEIGPTQLPRVHRAYESVLDTLDAPRRFDLFVAQNPVINAGAVGMDDPFIVLNSGTVLALSDAQLRSVLGYEVGHIMSGHVLYKTMLKLLLRMGTFAMAMPVTGLAMFALVAALLEWDRKSELSADRASLLACQDQDLVRSALLRMAGGVPDADIGAFSEQARRYEEEGGVVDSVLKTLALLGRSHPFPVLRLRELDRWVGGGDYGRILGGEYPKRSEDPQEGAFDSWKDSVHSYAEGVKASTDDLSDWVKSAGEGVNKKGSEAWGWVKGKVGKKGPPGPKPDDAPRDDAPRDDAPHYEADEDGVIDIDPTPKG